MMFMTETDDIRNQELSIVDLCTEIAPILVQDAGQRFGTVTATAESGDAARYAALDPDHKLRTLHKTSSTRQESLQRVYDQERLARSLYDAMGAADGCDYRVRCAGGRELTYSNVRRLNDVTFACEFDHGPIARTGMDVIIDTDLANAAAFMTRAWGACLKRGFTPVGCVLPSTLMVELPRETAETDLASIVADINRAGSGDELALKAEGRLCDPAGEPMSSCLINQQGGFKDDSQM